MFEKVKSILINELNLKNVDILPESRIKEDLGADSLDILQLLLSIEESYGIQIPDEKLADFSTVQSIIDYLEKIGFDK